MSVQSTGTDSTKVTLAIAAARAAATKPAAQAALDKLNYHKANLEGLSSFCCRTTIKGKSRELTEDEKAKGTKELLVKINNAIAELQKKHGIGSSNVLPIAGATTTAALAVGHYFGYLSPVLSTIGSYMPSVSLGSVTSLPGHVIGGAVNATKAGFSFITSPIANATSTLTTNLAATATAVDNIWGVSALTPSFLQASFFVGSVGTALTLAYLAKQHFAKPKQA